MIRKVCLIALAAFAITVAAHAQERTITGVVRSDDGQTLPGANVSVKGTQTGTSTDGDGRYSITVPGNDAVLVFSFVGMDPREEVVGDRKSIDVGMVTGRLLKEVVVDALGFERDKRTVGGASTTIGSDKLTNTGEMRLINSLAGKSAGINIVQSTGEPGAGSKIQIRGATSILGDLQPLIVIDGVPMYNDSYYGEAFGGNLVGSGGSVGSGGGVTQQSRLNDINPNDIASMEIIRGATAAALWGSRAANGVIMITTKKGKAGVGGQKMNVNVSSSVGFDVINRRVPLQNTYGQGFDGIYTEGPSFSWGDKIADRSGGVNTYVEGPGQYHEWIGDLDLDGEVDPEELADVYAGYFETENGKYYNTLQGQTDYYDADGNLALAANNHGGKNSQETYDIYDQIFKTGVTFDNNVSVSAADNNGNVYFSVSDMRQDGIILENSDYRKNTIRANLTRFLNERWTLTSNMAYTHSSSNRVQMGSNLSGLFLGGLRASPDFDGEDYWGTYVDPLGNLYPDRQRAYRDPIGANGFPVYDNPQFIMRDITSTSIVDRLIGKFEVGFDAFDWLNFTLRNGIDYYNDKREDYYPVQSAGENFGGRFSNESLRSLQFNMDLIARANWKLNDDIAGMATLGTNLNMRSFDDQGSTIRGFINPYSPPNGDNGNITQALDYSDAQNGQSIYTSVNAELYDMLFVNLTGRNDWLSTLPASNRSFFYPAVDAAWEFTQVMSDNDILSNGKLRAGLGQVGRGPDPYSTKTYFFAPSALNIGWGESWGPGLDPVAYGGAFAQNSIAGNAELRPEIKTEWEVGADLRFLNDRITLSATYYSNVTKDLILQVDVPESSGFLTQIANAAEITNKGVELELGADVLKTDDFVWNVYGNFTRNRNEVTDMAGTEQIQLAGFSSGASAAVVGHQLGVLWGGTWERDANGELLLDSNGYPQLGAEAGVIGDPNPDFRAGLGTKMFWKGISANVLFDMSRGMEMWNGTRGALAYFGKAEMTNVETTFTAEEAASTTNYLGVPIADMYPHLENSDGSYTVRGEYKDFGAGEVFLDEYYYYVGPGSGFTGPEEAWVEDASWTRLREVSIGYTLDSDAFKAKTKLQAATLTFTGRNLLLWTKYQGNDPDQNLNGPGNNGFGLDYFQNPSTKTYMFTLNLTF